MSATTLYRIATVLFVIFTLGHTVGFLRFTPPTAEGIAVWDAMNNVRLGAHGSYAGIYRGFGLYISLYLAFSALLTWHLGQLARTDPVAIGPLGWTLVVIQALGFVLSWMYFSAPPAVFSAVLTLLLGASAWLAQHSPMRGTTA